MKKKQYDLNGDTISIPIPESYKDCMTLIKSDRYRVSGKIESSISIIFRAMKPFQTKSALLFWLRLSQYNGWLRPICRYMYARVCKKAHVQLGASTKIGYGFFISHNVCPMVINSGTIIGNNVNVSQFLSIGTNNYTPAMIGDNVYIGPNVCIVEDVKIGNNSTIGAGAVVSRNIPNNSTAVGVPAKVIHYNNPRRHVNRRYPCE